MRRDRHSHHNADVSSILSRGKRLTAERRTALVHGAAGAEPARDLAARLGTTEPAARDLAASSVLAFRQTVLRSMPIGTGARMPSMKNTSPAPSMVCRRGARSRNLGSMLST